jgi:hypothetical protein
MGERAFDAEYAKQRDALRALEQSQRDAEGFDGIRRSA